MGSWTHTDNGQHRTYGEWAVQDMRELAAQDVRGSWTYGHEEWAGRTGTGTGLTYGQLDGLQEMGYARRSEGENAMQ